MKILIDHSNPIIKLRRLDIIEDSVQWLEIASEKCLEWTGTEVPKSIEESKSYLRSLEDNEDIDFWIIADIAKNTMIGTYWIAKPIKQDNKIVVTAEAQRLSEKYWRSGLMQQVRRLVYLHYFNELKVNEIHAQAWKNNIASCKSMEKCGFILKNSDLKYFKKKDEFYFENEYVLTSENLDIKG